VAPTAEALSDAAAARFTALAAEATAERGCFSVALAGGRTPLPVYRALAAAPYVGQIDWRHAHVFWADERCVPPAHTDSNFGAAHRALLTRVPIPPAQVHRMRGEDQPRRAANDYCRELARFWELPPCRVAPGRLDLVLLGIGQDGHIASLFPHAPALGERQAWVVAHLPTAGSWRLTMTLPVINAARHVVFLVSGEEKASVLARVLGPRRQPEALPAQGVRPAEGDVTWLVDAAAARLVAPRAPPTVDPGRFQGT
jgi:6-phosphogluconolactonase